MRRVLSILAVVCCIAVSVSAQPGHFFIDSKPSGALIELDGSILDSVQTPTILTLKPGQYRVTVRKGYFTPVAIDVSIASGEYVRRTIEFEPTSGVKKLSDDEVEQYGEFSRLAVITDLPGAEVWVDGVKVAMKTPLLLTSLSPGEHHIGVAYDTLTFDSMMTLPYGESKLYVELTELVATAPTVPQVMKDDSVTLRITLDVPGCDYRLPDAPGSPVIIRGADPRLIIVSSGGRFELSGTNIAATRKDFDHHDQLRKWTMPDTTVTATYRIPQNDSVLVSVEVFASEKRKFQDRKETQRHYRVYPIHGWFNRGEDIMIDVDIEPSGVIHFRYY